MDNRELVERWLSVFGRDVDKKMIADHVIGDNDHDGIAVYLQNNICRKGLKNEECKYI